MRYHALAADYDGTLAHHGLIDDLTWASLRRLRDSGRKLIMVTGRELDELLGLLQHPEMFDRIVAENGALLYRPATKALKLLAPPPPREFATELRRRGVERLSVGRVIVATWEPHQDTILHVIHDMALELQVIFNKGAVMVLPTGVNKATGLAAALHDLGLSPHNVVGVGDAENDHALITCVELGAAVSNALPSLKAHADLVTAADHGAGVSQLIDRIVSKDLADTAPQRHRIELGLADGGERIRLDPYATNAIICGTSGSGKSTLTTALLERLSDAGYQFCILDPEGDYSDVDFAVVLGAQNREPLVSEVLDVLRDPSRNAVVNMLGVAVDHRPEFFARLLPPLVELRTRTGRPHWLVVDEAHHLLPSTWRPAAELALRPHGTLYVTVHPGSVAKPVLETLNTVLVVGEEPDRRLKELAKVIGKKPPPVATDRLAPGHTLYWQVGAKSAHVLKTEPSKSERTRHSRKYVEGNLGPYSFFFRGPDKRLNLRAANLMLFVLMAEGVDDDTWTFHLRNGEYSRWFRDHVKDPALAAAAERVERDRLLSPQVSRAVIRQEIEKRYTLPADEPTGLMD